LSAPFLYLEKEMERLKKWLADNGYKYNEEAGGAVVTGRPYGDNMVDPDLKAVAIVFDGPTDGLYGFRALPLTRGEDGHLIPLEKSKRSCLGLMAMAEQATEDYFYISSPNLDSDNLPSAVISGICSYDHVSDVMEDMMAAMWYCFDHKNKKENDDVTGSVYGPLCHA